MPHRESNIKKLNAAKIMTETLGHSSTSEATSSVTDIFTPSPIYSLGL